MKRVKLFAANLGLGIGAVYAFFMVEDIAALFPPTFLLITKQTLAIAFAICLLINPKALITIGESMGSKLLVVLNTMFNKNKSNS